MAKLASGAEASGGGPASAASAAESAAMPAPQSAKPNRPGGLDSSYYYAAVPVSERKLPVQAPPKIGGSDVRVGEAQPVANGKIKQDIERKGPDNSYYYAHDRKTDYTVPTVPQKLNSDGSMTAWNGK